MRRLLIALLLSVSCSLAVAGPQPIIGACYAPDWPVRNGPDRLWREYAVAMKDYVACLGTKAMEHVEYATQEVKTKLERLDPSR